MDRVRAVRRGGDHMARARSSDRARSRPTRGIDRQARLGLVVGDGPAPRYAFLDEVDCERHRAGLDRAAARTCMKASALIAKCLENEGVRYVFGLPGEEILDVLDSLLDSDAVFIPTRHEQGAAFMADAYGRLTGRAGVCLATL